MYSIQKKIASIVISMSLGWLPILLLGQPDPSIIKEADNAFVNKEYENAYHLYQSALIQPDLDLSIFFKYAEAARAVHDYEEAEKYYTKILESQAHFLFGMTWFWLGQVKKSLGKYEEAIELFKVFAQLGLDEYYTYWSANEIQVCRWAMEQPLTDEKIQIDLLDENINSYHSETAPFEMGSHLYYSSSRSVFSGDKHLPKRHQTKMMVSKNLERGRPVANEFVEKGGHFCNTAFSNDWQRMYFSVCEYINSEETRCEVYFRDQDKDGNWLDKSERLPDFINIKGYNTTQPAIGYDPSTKTETLYFVSDRPGGKGKMDIWYCEITKTGFSKPTNLWEVNTTENEITPSFHNESQTLTFSSESHRGFGGFDIYYCKKLGDQWDMVTNLGRPINSGYDELYFSKNTNGNRAYFSSNRPGSLVHRSMNVGCCLDIYRVYINEERGALRR